LVTSLVRYQVQVIVCLTTRTAKTSQSQQWRRLTSLDRCCSSQIRQYTQGESFVTSQAGAEMVGIGPTVRAVSLGLLSHMRGAESTLANRQRPALCCFLPTSVPSCLCMFFQPENLLSRECVQLRTWWDFIDRRLSHNPRSKNLEN
jgi:hypothetical protein